jgi:hypothetical protein
MVAGICGKLRDSSSRSPPSPRQKPGFSAVCRRNSPVCGVFPGNYRRIAGWTMHMTSFSRDFDSDLGLLAGSCVVEVCSSLGAPSQRGGCARAAAPRCARRNLKFQACTSTNSEFLRSLGAGGDRYSEGAVCRRGGAGHIEGEVCSDADAGDSAGGGRALRPLPRC